MNVLYAAASSTGRGRSSFAGQVLGSTHIRDASGSEIVASTFGISVPAVPGVSLREPPWHMGKDPSLIAVAG
ncbi:MULTISPECIES: hypothetical protein [unclassified Methylobacterium]|uniref:hypothetical protein n=1 Tax=unclassified Methylobacterium TaxID=2615210 RepID=UPI0011147C93|nr:MULTISPECIES: hypothetical protein [unclassified Methylobacterium]WFS08514.1 hypothetical protein P9K36_04205 [Methylobacterium sp. 391_Methyba4]